MTFARTLRKGKISTDYTSTNEIVLVLDNVYDTFNVGGMYRVADASRVGKIYHCGETPIPPDPKISRSSVGLHQYIPHEYHQDIIKLIKNLKKLGYCIVSLEQNERSIEYNKAQYQAPIALVVGNESFGVSQEVIDLSDLVVELPMYGINQSLNVVVATGITLYQIRRILEK